MTKPEEQGRPKIVVGVDGSPSSQDALRWALAQARATGAAVDAIATWEQPVTYGWSISLPEGDFATGTREALADSVRAVTTDQDAAVKIRQLVVEGNAAQVLLEAAREADLLVLGSRGHGGFAGALLGSVGQHCVQHSPCPVVIVRTGEEK